jgi:2-dehydropantoate 2-reductase
LTDTVFAERSGLSQTRLAEKIAVIGAGGIGGVVAARLVEAGHPVQLCTRSPLSRLIVESRGVSRNPPVELISDPAAAQPLSWVFLATKAQETAGASGWLERLCGRDSTLVVLQNGIDHEARVRPFVPAARVVPALVHFGAERKAPGHIVEHGSGRLVVPDNDAARALAELLQGSGIGIELSRDFLTASWMKLLGNAFGNPLTALTMRRAEVFDDPAIRALAGEMIAETVAVGRAAGARFPPDVAEKAMASISRFPRDSGSSMLYDRLAGRPLEHEFLTGAVVRAAERNGVDAPLNRAMLALLGAISGRIAS